MLLQLNNLLLLTVLPVVISLLQRFGLGSGLSYLLSGILFGPYCLSTFKQTDFSTAYSTLAAALFFVIGLHVSRQFSKISSKLLTSVLVLVIIIALVYTSIITLFQIPHDTAMLISLALVPGSISLDYALLTRKGISTQTTKYETTALNLQLLIVIPLLIIVVLFAQLETVTSQSILQQGAIVIAAIAILAGSRFILLPILNVISQQRAPELLWLTALVVVTLASILFSSTNIPAFLVAFLGGISLAGAATPLPRIHNIKSIRNLLTGLLLLLTGIQIDLSFLLSDAGLIAQLVLTIVLIKLVVFWLIDKFTTLSELKADELTVGLAHSGELAFIILVFAYHNQMIETAQYQILLLAVVGSWLFSNLMLSLNKPLSKLKFQPTVARKQQVVGTTEQQIDSLSAELSAPHAYSAEHLLSKLHSSRHGLSSQEARLRLDQYGRNTLPQPKSPGLLLIFVNQFRSPLIYVLLLAAVVSMLIAEWSDAIFISAVLLLNAIIGTTQEYSAQKAALALQQLVSTKSRVIRDGDAAEINAQELVPGDIVLLESGDKIPADLRLLNSLNLQINESLITGESAMVVKSAEHSANTDSALGDRFNMVFAGTLVDRGRAHGLVTSTALNTELGKIAASLFSNKDRRAPLLVRMEKFTQRIAILVGFSALLLMGIELARGAEFSEILLFGVALAVSVIPEGLPVALTVALAISMQRMAKRHVIVRRLVAVEALGSCTYIATDKTGTLTVNQLTVKRIALPGLEPWEVTGQSQQPVGTIVSPQGALSDKQLTLLQRFCHAAVLANEGFLAQRGEGWTSQGDAVDVALLIMAHKVGFVQTETINTMPLIASLPFESVNLFSASLNQVDGEHHVFVKGALEKLLSMCDKMVGLDEDVELQAELIERQAQDMACQGYRVIALASGALNLQAHQSFAAEHLQNLTLLGLVGLIDPLREQAKDAVGKCQAAGIEVAMITGDHPLTALSIARELQLADSMQQVISGSQLKQSSSQQEFDQLTKNAHVFARVEPTQKLDIVKSLQRNGHFVAVSGDGANDAPALQVAQVGIAMGKSGTDVARESADLIISDDNFASIVSGVEEGRIAYANVRKVIYLLISTGASELVMFILALIFGIPIPLVAVQLLWLNLVTNGIQDIALAFEPEEGDELNHPPRSPKETIFNRLMIERVVLAALVIGTIAFTVFQWFLMQGYSIEQARNYTLLLMVLFENVHVFNCRSEKRSALFHNPLRNPLLLIGTFTAQIIHIAAMYIPGLNQVLHIEPVPFEHWMYLLGIASSVFVVMEIHKFIRTLIRNNE